VGPCIFGVWDQPIDRPPLDLIGRPRSLIFRAASRAGARYQKGRDSRHLSGSRPRDRRFHVEH
jgi:hypothetical protein